MRNRETQIANERETKDTAVEKRGPLHSCAMHLRQGQLFAQRVTICRRSERALTAPAVVRRSAVVVNEKMSLRDHSPVRLLQERYSSRRTVSAPNADGIGPGRSKAVHGRQTTQGWVRQAGTVETANRAGL